MSKKIRVVILSGLAILLLSVAANYPRYQNIEHLAALLAIYVCVKVSLDYWLDFPVSFGVSSNIESFKETKMIRIIILFFGVALGLLGAYYLLLEVKGAS